MSKNVIIIGVNKDLNCDIISDDIRDKHNDLNFYNSLTFRKQIEQWIDDLGEESAKAQSLKVAITSSVKFTKSFTNDKIYLLISRENDNKCAESAIGLIRVGIKNLYLENDGCLTHVNNCYCILDFYIRHQRCGYGKYLLSAVTQHLSIPVSQLAFDRPTIAMLSCLKRHFKLDPPLSQHNHFVIFRNFKFPN